jgi:SSS family solute:Na+ symporter
MFLGGGTTLVLILTRISLPLGLDANVFGIAVSLLSFIFVQWTRPGGGEHAAAQAQ